MALPIACTLSQGEYAARTRALHDLATRALRSRTAIEGGQRLTFAGDDRTERELRDAVAAEAECCAFLTMSLVRRGERLVLDVTGPDEARPVMAALFAEPGEAPGSPPARGVR